MKRFFPGFSVVVTLIMMAVMTACSTDSDPACSPHTWGSWDVGDAATDSGAGAYARILTPPNVWSAWEKQ